MSGTVHGGAESWQGQLPDQHPWPSEEDCGVPHQHAAEVAHAGGNKFAGHRKSR